MAGDDEREGMRHPGMSSVDQCVTDRCHRWCNDMDGEAFVMSGAMWELDVLMCWKARLYVQKPVVVLLYPCCRSRERRPRVQRVCRGRLRMSIRLDVSNSPKGEAETLASEIEASFKHKT